MKTVYLIPGLGTDRRLFQNLKLERCRIEYREWIAPFQGETLPAYARRLGEGITGPDAVVIGVSLGGMMAVEIAKSKPGVQAILISSIKGRHELPWFARLIPLVWLLPLRWWRQPTKLVKWMLGADYLSDKELYHNILTRFNPAFTRWALTAIRKWRNREVPTGLVHLHGTADRLLPIRPIRHVDYVIEGGSHIMVYDRAQEIGIILQRYVDRV